MMRNSMCIIFTICNVVTVINSGSLVGICVEECSRDVDCPKGMVCAFNGCGHICSSSAKPGLCPTPGGGTCVEECSRDVDCPGIKKCCFNGCGRTCISPVRCTTDPSWRGNVIHKKKECLNCSCIEILEKSKKLMKKACRKKDIKKACCLICESLKKN